MIARNRFLGSMIAALVFGAGVMGMARDARAVPLPPEGVPLTNGLTFTVEDKQFTIDSCVVTAIGVVGITACNQLTVTALVEGGLLGFALNGAIASIFGGQNDVSIHYHVDVLDPNFAISDAHLDMAGGASGTGVAQVDEVLTDALHNPLAHLHATAADPSDDAVFAPVTTVFVAKDILTITGVDGVAQISIVDQLFSQTHVPEPATMAVLGAGLFGMGLLRRRRE